MVKESHDKPETGLVAATRPFLVTDKDLMKEYAKCFLLSRDFQFSTQTLDRIRLENSTNDISSVFAYIFLQI